MDKCTRKSITYHEKCLFVYERKFYDENTQLVPQKFNIITLGDDNQCTLRWEIEYSILKTVIYPSYNLTNITDVKVSLLDKLSGDNAAEVKIKTKLEPNDSDILKYLFNSENSLKQQSEKFEKYIYKDSVLQIELSITHNSKSLSKTVDNYSKFLKTEMLHDVVIVIGDKKISANIARLTADSPVFKSMFENDMLEKKTGQVEITDIEENIFHLLLDFVYFEKVDTNDFDVLLKLLEAADKYAMKSLINVCEDRISKHLNIDNVIDAFITADFVKAEVLKRNCKKFIFENKNEVVSTDGYKNLIKLQRLDLVSELFCEI